jgi:alpha-ketoglutarate-dependent taurine dioxygenase
MDVTVNKLSPLGTEIAGADVETLLNDERIPGKVLSLLEESGVLVFSQLGLDDAQQAAFSRSLGETVKKDQKGWSKEFPDIFNIAMDADRKAGAYMKGTFAWHIDGMTLEIPSKATVLTGRVLSDAPGEGNTEFASTYAAYDRLSDEEKDRFADLKVWHSLEVTYKRDNPNGSVEDLARARAEPPKLQPLVWTHHTGRKSLVIGTTAATIEGMDDDEGAAFLADLLERSTRPEYVYSHTWSVGDMVIWDNRGVLHRALPYAEDSGREMHRCTIMGDEPIQ